VDRLFLDANVLFSAAYRPDGGLRRLWELAEVELVTSVYAVAEAQRNLSGDGKIELERLLDKVSVLGTVVGEIEPLPLVLPDKDQPILGGAMHAKATHLLTGDFTHFGTYYGRKVGGILIQPPADYLRGKEEKKR